MKLRAYIHEIVAGLIVGGTIGGCLGGIEGHPYLGIAIGAVCFGTWLPLVLALTK